MRNRKSLVNMFLIIWAMLTVLYLINYIWFPGVLQAGLLGFAIGMFFGHLLIRDQARIIDMYHKLTDEMLVSHLENLKAYKKLITQNINRIEKKKRGKRKKWVWWDVRIVKGM